MSGSRIRAMAIEDSIRSRVREKDIIKDRITMINTFNPGKDKE